MYYWYFHQIHSFIRNYNATQIHTIGDDIDRCSSSFLDLADGGALVPWSTGINNISGTTIVDVDADSLDFDRTGGRVLITIESISVDVLNDADTYWDNGDVVGVATVVGGKTIDAEDDVEWIK